ncbi:MAG: glycosyltransferase family 4 protein [Pelolinea sp.]|nr:glycosyltransferase family 4 protein [Pelolinea sp.]
MAKSSICILPKLKGAGGPSSFQSKLIKGLGEIGISVNHDPRDPSTSALLIIGGTRKFDDLVYAKHSGIRIVQRLDGMNWLHKKKFTGIKHYIRSERMNLQLSFTRRMFADAVVYQSNFTRDWWHTVYGSLKTPHTVIYNGVDLDTFSPAKINSRPINTIRLLVVEGSFKGGHERDLLNAVELANHLPDQVGKPVELLIAGNLPESMKTLITTHPLVTINWLGLVPHEEIPELDRSAHILFPAEINAACPNSLIEALGCGLPVVSYATGSLPELIGENGGIVVPYGRDYWNLEPPKVEALAKAAQQIIDDLPAFRSSARTRAEDLFSVESMVEKYRQILLDDLNTYPA